MMLNDMQRLPACARSTESVEVAGQDNLLVHVFMSSMPSTLNRLNPKLTKGSIFLQ